MASWIIESPAPAAHKDKKNFSFRKPHKQMHFERKDTGLFLLFQHFVPLYVAGSSLRAWPAIPREKPQKEHYEIAGQARNDEK